MARPIDQIIKDTLGNQLGEIIRLTSAVEQQQDRIADLERQLAALTDRPKEPQPDGPTDPPDPV